MRVWRALAIVTLFLGGIFVTSGSALSALILQNDAKFGANSVMLDTSTDLEWLNLRFSQGLSPAQVMAQFGTGGTFEGWRHATSEEFISLATSFFSEKFYFDICCNTPIDLVKTMQFANLFGPTGSGASNFPILEGFFGPLGGGPDLICANRFSMKRIHNKEL